MDTGVPRGLASMIFLRSLQSDSWRALSDAVLPVAIASMSIKPVDASVAAALVDRLEPLLKLLDDDDLDCKKKSLGLVHAAAHNRLSLLEAHSGFVESRLAALAALKIEHVVDLGPFKHKVDDGLPLRKAALAALATMSSFIMMAAPVRESFSTPTRKIARAGSRCTKGM